MCNYPYCNRAPNHPISSCPIPKYFETWPVVLEHFLIKKDPIIQGLERLDENLPHDPAGFCLFHSKDINWKFENEFTLRFRQLWVLLKAIELNIVPFNPQKIDLSECIFVGKQSIKISDYHFAANLHLVFSNSTFEDPTYINNVVLNQLSLDFQSCRFKKNLEIVDSKIQQITFTSSHFEEGWTMKNNQFQKGLTARKLQIGGMFKIAFNDFQDDVNFDALKIDAQNIHFIHNQFKGKLHLNNCQFNGYVDLMHNKFQQEVQFFNINFKNFSALQTFESQAFMQLLNSLGLPPDASNLLAQQFNRLYHPDTKGIDRNDTLTSIFKEIYENLPSSTPIKIDQFLFDGQTQNNPVLLAEYDGFLSFAGEDSAFAEQLYRELEKENLTIWFSRIHLNYGDSILGVINQAINRSRYGIVILSKHTFSDKKHFPLLELRAIVNQEMYANMKLIPIYLGIDHQFIIQHGILFSDYFAIEAKGNIKEVAQTITARIKQGNHTNNV